MFEPIKEVLEKINKMAKVFEAIDFEQLKRNLALFEQYKKKLKQIKYLFVALLAFTALNTVLITLVLFKK